jgi:hypothetical protein
MAARPSIVLALVGALLSLGASYRTQNFVVEAPTREIAEQVGKYAEHYRREKAIQWLGQEMPPWPEPCPLHVTVTMNGSGGATTFAFDRGQILGQKMEIQGTLDRLLASVLPHEVTHTVFAHYFRQPVPRWADEGGAVLSEDELERGRHDKLVREILNRPGRAIPLSRLFRMTQYPQDVMVLYAEGYSVTEFLVSKNGRPAFLQFLARGMQGDWDGAARAHYGFNNVGELEQAWVQSLRNAKPGPKDELASNRDRRGPVDAEPARRVVVRQTAPPAQPLLDAPQPIYRGQSDQDDRYEVRPVSRPVSPPEDDRRLSPASPPPGGTLPPPPPIRLGAPQSDAPPSPPHLGQPVPSNPVGYSPR